MIKTLVGVMQFLLYRKDEFSESVCEFARPVGIKHPKYGWFGLRKHPLRFRGFCGTKNHFAPALQLQQTLPIFRPRRVAGAVTSLLGL
jgi:hypothetical protein